VTNKDVDDIDIGTSAGLVERRIVATLKKNSIFNFWFPLKKDLHVARTHVCVPIQQLSHEMRVLAHDRKHQRRHVVRKNGLVVHEVGKEPDVLEGLHFFFLNEPSYENTMGYLYGVTLDHFLLEIFASCLTDLLRVLVAACSRCVLCCRRLDNRFGG